MRQPGELSFDGNCYLLLNFFCRVTREKRNDSHLDVGYIGKSFYRQLLKREYAAGNKQYSQQNGEQRLRKSKRNNSFDHFERSLSLSGGSLLARIDRDVTMDPVTSPLIHKDSGRQARVDPGEENPSQNP